VTPRQVITNIAVSAASSGLLIGLFKEWLSARLKASIQHEYDKKFETFKTQLKTEQELAILEIKTALAREAAFHAAAHTSFAEGQKAAMERKLSAVDRLWSGVVQFRAGLPPELALIEVMTVDEYKAAKDHPSFQRLAGVVSTERFSKLAQPGLEEVRPYVGEYMWAVFFCYQAIFIRISVLLHLGKTDAEKIEWHKDGGNQNLLKAVLTPEELQEFDKITFSKISWLQRRLESKLLMAAQKIISGVSFGTESLEQARLIQLRIAELSPPKPVRENVG
jgi:hypothetical protein